MHTYLVTNNHYFCHGLTEALGKKNIQAIRISVNDITLIEKLINEETESVILHLPRHDPTLFSAFSSPYHFDKVIILTSKSLMALYKNISSGWVLDEKQLMTGMDILTASIALGVNVKQAEPLTLTEKERFVLLHTLKGSRVSSISHYLGSSLKTVYTQQRNALRKLGARKVTDVMFKG